MPERLDHALSIARCAPRNKPPNDQAQRRGRIAKESSLRLIRVFCSALLCGDALRAGPEHPTPVQFRLVARWICKRSAALKLPKSPWLMWNSNIGNEFMQSADGRRNDNLLAEGIQQGMYSPPARTMPGDNHLQVKLPKIFHCLWNDLFHLRSSQVETSHCPIERYWIEEFACMN